MLKISIALLISFLTIIASAQEIQKQLVYEDISLLDGSLIMKQELQNKVIVVNLWGTWCKPCIQELPALNQLEEKYRNEGVVFLAVTSAERDTSEKINRLLEKRDFNFRHMMPTNQSIFMDLADGAKYPTTLVYGKSGLYEKKYVGSLSSNEMKSISKKIDDLLKE